MKLDFLTSFVPKLGRGSTINISNLKSGPVSRGLTEFPGRPVSKAKPGLLVEKSDLSQSLVSEVGEIMVQSISTTAFESN